MNKVLAVIFSLACVFLLTSTAFAVNLYVDAAPNKYGSPDYAGWEAATFSAVAAGTFVNMSNGINPSNAGTTDFEIQDEVVYSFGDLGKRLTWTYWIPNETVQSLTGRFKIGLTNIWGGDSWDFYDYYYGASWLEPTSWIDYGDGVIGTAGMAWWGAYNVNTEEALAADIADWGSVAESWIFTTRLDDVETSITSNRAPVPEPSTIILLGGGLVGLVWYRRKRK